VLLDEVSSSVDRGTDSLMQHVIREEFRGWTIIAVAHRLEALIDFDKVAVMERGEIIEYGNPKDLLVTNTSCFKRLWETSKGMNASNIQAQSDSL
jgi:ATP-binding cassette, subfamily C (CFTR/MRP), member 1